MAGNFIRESVTHPLAHQIFIGFLLGASRLLSTGDTSWKKGTQFLFSRSLLLDEVIGSATNDNATSLYEYEKAAQGVDEGPERELTTYWTHS